MSLAWMNEVAWVIHCGLKLDTTGDASGKSSRGGGPLPSPTRPECQRLSNLLVLEAKASSISADVSENWPKVSPTRGPGATTLSEESRRPISRWGWIARGHQLPHKYHDEGTSTCAVLSTVCPKLKPRPSSVTAQPPRSHRHTHEAQELEHGNADWTH